MVTTTSRAVDDAAPAQVPCDLAAAPLLAAALESSGYTVDGVGDLLGERAARALHREQPLPAARVTAASSRPLATLIRLFALGRAVPADELDRAMPTFGTDSMSRLGLIGPAEPGLVRALFDLRPYAEEQGRWYVLSDLSEVMTGRPLPVEHVLGIGGASTTLASWTPRRQVEAALDLGTGCGVQSLHLGGHAGRIVATDTSARALAVARFNAALNGQEWDLRRGDLFDPVGGEQFDLVVSNPPFVITPRGGEDGVVPLYEYRDGGRVGHAIVAGLVGRVGEHLRPGGVAQLLGNWEVARGEDWPAVVGGWLERSDLDAWVVQRETQDPCEYAELWAGDGGHRSGTPGFEEMYGAWLDDFESRDVDHVGFGVITLQRPATDRAPFREFTEAYGPVAAPMGPTVDAGLRARTWLAEHGDDGVFRTAWRVAPDVTDERFGAPGADDPSVIQVRQGGGLRRTVALDTVTAALISVCDGELTAAAALDAIAGLLEQDAQTVREQALPTLRGLVADGFLERA